MKIPRILSNTRVSELNWVTQQMIDEYTKGDYSADAYLTEVFNQVIDTNDQLGLAIQRDVAESELAELDDHTDTIFTCLHGLTKGYTYHPDEATAGAGVKLFKRIDKCGLEVKTKSYGEEYGLLSSLITDSKAPEYQAAITQLPGCDVRFQQLETAVSNFASRQNIYKSAKDDAKNQESATVIKRRLIDIIKDDLSVYLNAMQKVNPAVYGELSQFIANRISESNAAVRSRKQSVEA